MIKVIFQDGSILVIEKVAGLITISDRAEEQTLATLLEKEFSIDPQVSIVHRLDRDTSGVMVIAKTPEIKAKLQEQFKDRKVKKEYQVLVHGVVQVSGVVDVNLTRVPGGGNKFVVSEEGRLAATEYEPVKQLTIDNAQLTTIFPSLSKKELNKLYSIHYTLYTLLSCKPLTGRTHQIRVHLKYINHPIVSDRDYCGRKTYKLDLKWCPRQFLHAKKIGFYHPGSGEWMEFESPLAEDLEKALNKLENG